MIEVVIDFLLSQYQLVLIGSVISGVDILSHLAGVISVQEDISFWEIIIYPALALFTSDLLIFYITKQFNLQEKFSEKKDNFIVRYIHGVLDAVQKIGGKNDLITFILLRFVFVGQRLILALFFVSREDFTVRKIFFPSLISSFVWVFAIIGSGYFVGKGLLHISKENLTAALSIYAITLFSLAIIISTKQLKKKYNKDATGESE